MNAYPYPELVAGQVADFEWLDAVPDGQRQVGDFFDVVGPYPLRQPRHHHIGVPDRLNLVSQDSIF